MSCAQRSKADDLPEHYKCPQCTGEFQKLLKQYLDNPQTSIQQRDFCDLCGLEEVEKEKPLLCCTKCDRAFHADCGGETNGIFTGNGHWHWQVVSTSPTDPCPTQPHQFFLSHSVCGVRAPCTRAHVFARVQCPECTGTAAAVFNWSKMTQPAGPSETAAPIFVENKAGNLPAPANVAEAAAMGKKDKPTKKSNKEEEPEDDESEEVSCSRTCRLGHGPQRAPRTAHLHMDMMSRIRLARAKRDADEEAAGQGAVGKQLSFRLLLVPGRLLRVQCTWRRTRIRLRRRSEAGRGNLLSQRPSIRSQALLLSSPGGEAAQVRSRPKERLTMKKSTLLHRRRSQALLLRSPGGEAAQVLRRTKARMTMKKTTLLHLSLGSPGGAAAQVRSRTQVMMNMKKSTLLGRSLR